MILIITEIINDADTYHTCKVFGAGKLHTVTASEYMKYLNFQGDLPHPFSLFYIIERS